MGISKRMIGHGPKELAWTRMAHPFLFMRLGG